MPPKGETLAETQKRQTGPRDKWEKGTVWGPERGLGVGLPPREKVDVPLEIPDDMDESGGQRSEYTYDLYCLPQPVVLVTTADLDGNVNCAPKNWVTCAGSHGFAFVCSTDHDTWGNVQTTKEFVVNVPGVDLVGKLHALARKGTPSWENELTRAGLTALPSRKVRPPRVAECRVHLECRAELLYEVDSARELKTDKQGTDVLIYGKIVALSGDAEVVRAPTYEERVRRIRPFVLTPIWGYQAVDDPREVPGAWDIEY
ncbi:MAG TPA: flavin reductase family protein [Candidatus Thermoplasmatota archaeon]|nr:flavin reductase family protein [Candidatus Thermoplasmatota archaeon]